MAIRRGDKSMGKYTGVAHVTARDARLSFKARGILLYMLSRPDDWQFNENEIAKNTADGIKAVRSGIRELIDNGYIVRKLMRDARGKIAGYDYTVYELSTVMPLSENGLSENGKTENAKRHTTKNDTTKTDNTKNDNTNHNGSPGANDYDDDKDTFSLSDLSKIHESNEGFDWYRWYFGWYGRLYEIHKGQPHPRLKKGQIRNAANQLHGRYSTAEEYQTAAILYFQNVRQCDHNLNHFVTDGIQEMRDIEMMTQDGDDWLYRL